MALHYGYSDRTTMTDWTRHGADDADSSISGIVDIYLQEDDAPGHQFALANIDLAYALLTLPVRRNATC